MKNILFLEDDGWMKIQTLTWLQEDYPEYTFYDCSGIDLAKDIINDKNVKIDCIITDLNMSDEFLEEHRGESEGCVLSGWVWLKYYVYENEKYKNVKCIIYSGYLENLQTYRKKSTDNLFDKEIYYVDKGGNDDEGYERLTSKLNEIL